MKKFKEFITEEEGGVAPAMALGSANEVGTEDKTNVAGEPFKKKAIKSIRRNKPTGKL